MAETSEASLADARKEAAGLQGLLQRQHAEIRELEAKLAEAKSVTSPLAGAHPIFTSEAFSPSETAAAHATWFNVGLREEQHRQVAEINVLEDELAAAKNGVCAAWLQGPAVSIEHEVTRRKHIAKVRRLEASLAEARLSLLQPTVEPQSTVAWHAMSDPPVTAASMTAGVQPMFWSEPQDEILMENVIVERKRKFGNQMFKLWVEDCAQRGGVRVHALDTVSLAKTHVDLKDTDVQAMFDHYSVKKSRLLKRSTHEQNCDCEHNKELKEFLCRLLDSTYFELDESGDEVELRIPDVVEPQPEPTRTLVDVPSTQAQGAPSTKIWIHQQLLPPRSATSRSQGTGHTRPSSARTTKAYPMYTPAAPAAPATSRRPAQRMDGEIRRPSRPQSARQQSARPQSARPQSARPQSAQLNTSNGSMPMSGGVNFVDVNKSLDSHFSTQRTVPLSALSTHPVAGPAGRGLLVRRPASQSTRVPSHSIGRPIVLPQQRSDESLNGQNQSSQPTQESTSSLHTGQQRKNRPSSAKALKHKRVADTHDGSTIYDDLEPSICGELDMPHSHLFSVNSAWCSEPEVPAALAGALVPVDDDAAQQAFLDDAERDGGIGFHTVSHVPSAWSPPPPPVMEPRASTPPRTTNMSAT